MIAIRLRNENGITRESVFVSFPVRIGRAPTNDFILLDDSVSKNHAVIEQNIDGRVVLKDLGSRNGIRVGNSPGTAFAIKENSRFFIGLVEIEIEPLLAEATRVVNVNEWQHFNRRRSLPDHLRLLFFGIVGWLLFIIVQPQFWSPSRADRDLVLVTNLLGIAVLLPLCSLALMLVLRTMGRKLRIADTLQALCKIIWVYALVEIVGLTLYYPLANSLFLAASTLMLGVFIIWAVVTLAGIRRQPLTPAFRITWALIVTVLVLALKGIVMLKSRGQPQTDYLVLPPLQQYYGQHIDLDGYLDKIARAAQHTQNEAAATRIKMNHDD